MTVLTPGRTDPAQPASRPASRALLLLTGCSLTVFLAVGLLVHWRVTGQFDRWVLGLLGSPKGSWTARLADAVTTLGDATPLLTILILAGVLVPVRWGGGWRLLALPSAAAVVAFSTSSVIKQLTARARPPSLHWASTAQGFAFPSGHATTATAGYLVLAVLISSLMPTARRRRAVRGAGIAVAFLVGASRIVLAVHWPTDVIAGWALGTAVAAATLALAPLPTGSGPSRHGAPPATEPPR
jgi:undecaprenyl-diphosphatase